MEGLMKKGVLTMTAIKPTKECLKNEIERCYKIIDEYQESDSQFLSEQQKVRRPKSKHWDTSKLTDWLVNWSFQTFFNVILILTSKAFKSSTYDHLFFVYLGFNINYKKDERTQK